MNRTEMLNRVKAQQEFWDFVIIGGGATGVGCAVDAASRGFSVLLLEQSDFGKGTSSRSTKLVHGGVRYLAQGNVSLVREALKERGTLARNAAHLVKTQRFIVPVYSLQEKVFYGSGLKIYNLLSGKYGFGKSRILSTSEVIARLPNVRGENLRGGILYFDGQFDDARLLINLAQTAAEQSAVMLNYARVFELTKDENGKINGVNYQDTESGEVFTAHAKIVINAAGAFCDAVRRFSVAAAAPIITPSQGIHLVFDRQFLPSENALMIPKTPDGRVLFAIPWHGKTLIGTTDTPIEKAPLEPQALESEIEFVLATIKNYLTEAPTRADILSVFAGIRPLVKNETAVNTAKLARDHTIEIDEHNLLTITGGKWTTYRSMAEDAVNQAIDLSGLPARKSVTENLQIHGATTKTSPENELGIYGTDAEHIKKIITDDPKLKEKLHENLPYAQAEVVWCCRSEMARTVEDVLARRTRALFLDAGAAIESAGKTAEIMAIELEKDAAWIAAQIEDFNEIARGYLIENYRSE